MSANLDLDRVPTKRDWMPLLIAATSLVISGFVGYSNNDKALAQRVTTVEVQQVNDAERMQHMERNLEQRLERVEQKVDKLLDRPALPPGWSYRDPNTKR